MRLIIGAIVFQAILLTVVTSQKCPVQRNRTQDCDFDSKDMCTWSRLPGDGLYFISKSGPSTGNSWWRRTGPANDHTKGNNQGYYIYIETSSPTRGGQKAAIRSQRLKASPGNCCNITFWYHMFGGNIGSLSVQIENEKTGAVTSVWTKKGAQGDKWNQGVVTLNSASPYYVRIEAVAGGGDQGDIAIDDISFDGCPPGPAPVKPTFPPGVGLGDCDFEQCYCCWTNQPTGNQYSWYRGRGHTPSIGTGPSSDHTRGDYSGHYMFIESSNLPVKQNWRPHEAKLKSRRLKAVSRKGQCFFSLWYHMHGSSVGRLTILKEPDNDWIHPHLFDTTGDQGDMWKNVTVDVYTSGDENRAFVLSVRADQISDASRYSDIAVDDFSFSAGCDKYFEDTGACYNMDVCHPNFTVGLPSPPSPGPVTGDCNFEDDNCFWNNLLCDDFDWFPRRGGTPSWSTGPGGDHTSGSGWYLYYEAGDWQANRNRRLGQKAIFESPNIKAQLGSCKMQFWYHMWGSNMGALHIYQKSDAGFRLLKEIRGDQGNSWIQQNITLTSYSDYRIHIIASQGDGERGDIGLDDIKFYGCKFDSSASTSYCDSKLSLTTGCADGSREGLFTNPNVAGCLGDWDGLKSLRDRPTRHWCGNKFSNGNSQKCQVPADLCDSDNGWQVCGYGGSTSEIPGYLNSGDCKTAGYGRFSAGINHCNQRKGACRNPNTKTDYGCSHYDLDCDEPLCCGLECMDQSKVKCDGGFWPSATTYTPLSGFKGCSRLSAADAGGVMCCYNKSFVPPTPAPGLCTTCTFDNDQCGFYDEKSDDFNWKRRNGATPGWNTGPDDDHTLQNGFGYYMFIETGWNINLKDGDVAILRSPEYNRTALKCDACMIEFYYHMYGSDVGSLDLFVEETYDKGPISRGAVWTLSGNQGNEWKVAQIYPLNITSPTFHLLFLATATGGRYGDIAIDDIAIKACPGSPPPPPTCPPNQWRCADGRECIPLEQRCNGPANCKDESDEKGCLTECHELYCVNGGSCHIKYGESHCYCTWAWTGPRCNLPLYGTPPPRPVTVETTKMPEKTEAPPETLAPIVCSPQACEPHSLSCVCDPVSDPEYCLPCRQTKENCDTCVCQTLGEARRVCYYTQIYARALRESQTGVTQSPGQEGQSGSENNDNMAMYVAIGVSVAVVGIIIVVVVIYFIMRTKYRSQSENPANKARVMYTSDTASGIGNPVYSMYGGDQGAVDIDKFMPAAKASDAGMGDTNPLYNDPYEDTK